MFQNLATGQTLNTCDFFAYISSINWCSCTTDEVWLGNGTAKSGYDWFMYFQTNTPTCADQAPTCMSVHINDADQPGETLYVMSYPAIGIPTPTKAYQWQQSTDGVTWSDIIGANTASFVITNAYVGKYIRVQGTATNGVGSPAVCYSGAVPIVPANASPTNTIAPVISGSTTQGSTLTCTTGTWTGYPLPSFTFTWFANGVQVGTGSTYVLKLTDSLKNITCVVTATNGINPNGTATSNTITAGDYSPQNITAPTISGGTTLGSTLTCSVGSWAGTSITYSYQWYSGANPVGDNSAQYQLQLTDTLANITCVVTASNPVGANSATSNTITAGDFAPYNTIAPNIFVVGGGPANPGVTLQCDKGTWVGNSLTYSYQWYRGATPIGSNTDTYLIVTADQGSSITCEVTATNAGGTGTATSNNINVPSGPGATAPTNSTPPVIAVAGGGPAIIGSTMVVSVGTWNGTSPIVYTYEWFSGVVSVSNDPYYILVPTDIGKPITCVVTATNPYGFSFATSNTISATGLAPVNLIAPSIIGNNTPGDVLSLNLGSWSASPAITSYQYLWQYSTDNGGTWNNYSPSQTGATKTVLTADIGRLIRCKVTAINIVGNGDAYTNSILIDSAPINITAPVISGSTLVGSTLTTTDGTWTGSGTITFSYKWLRNGVAISGATSNTYTTILADSGENIQCEVTATNGIGPSIKTSNTIVPTSAPSLLQAPIIFGSYNTGGTLTAQDGVYGNYPASTITRKWQYSTDDITYTDYSPAQTGTTYTIQPSDTGLYIRILETATNGISPNVSTASNSIQIASLGACGAVIQGVPVISGTQIVSQTLSCSIAPLTITGSPTPSVTYQWYYGLTMIAGATSSTYTLQPAQSGERVWCRVTASNVNGTAYVDSNELAIFTTIADRYPTGWAYGWWPFLLRGAYYGQPLIRIIRDSDSAELNISHDSTGMLNVSAITAHCTGTTGRVMTIYDQIGGQNLTQTTNSLRPIIFTGGSVVTDGGVPIICNITVTSSNLTVPNSNTAGTFNFLHNGTQATYAVYLGCRMFNATYLPFGTGQASSTGFFIGCNTTNQIRCGVFNGATAIITNNSSNNTTALNKNYLVAIVNKVTATSATLRSKMFFNQNAVAANVQAGAVGTGAPLYPLYLGNFVTGSGNTPHFGALINLNETYFDEIREACREQLNFAL